MTDWTENFITTAASRETDERIMYAISKVARSGAEAVRIWENPTAAELVAVAEIATGNGRDCEPWELNWGGETLAALAGSA
jgi:hypothetical protein